MLEFKDAGSFVIQQAKRVILKMSATEVMGFGWLYKSAGELIHFLQGFAFLLAGTKPLEPVE
jgi:hypothetical protein